MMYEIYGFPHWEARGSTTTDLMVYNTKSERKEKFEPLENKTVKIYVCGPTVYDVPHIGHGRSYVFFDVVRRY